MQVSETVEALPLTLLGAVRQGAAMQIKVHAVEVEVVSTGVAHNRCPVLEFAPL